ncbi:cadherin-like beta sandwich domain-containing protein [Clostridium beijerinckii]|uniref:cadherin-like beta sandwich domain-containing protein n=1 Tax=Clostridium beijerinckii TaxID=1520 RepID=UPI00047D4C0E|nr:cadherin-like beta sandwich domain-containing protein [Clostridium beijerinckii]
MNKNIRRIIALTLTISAFSTFSAITSNKPFNILTTTAYASSYSPSTGELKTLKIKTSSGDTLDLRDGYNGDTVKLSDDKEYYAKLTDDSDGIKIDSEVKGSDYIVRIFTSDKADATAYKPGDEISLGKGDTTIYVRTYESLADFRDAKDKKKDVTICKEEYKINIRKTKASSNEDGKQDPIYIDNIQLSKGDITFLKQRTSYDIKVDSSVDEIKITAKPEDESDRVRIDGDLADSRDNYKKTVSLDNGKNEIKVKITDDKDNQRTYTLNITRGSSSSNQDGVYLDDLTLSEGDIDFSKDDSNYDVDLDESVDKITVEAPPEDEDYLVTINGDEVKSNDDYKKKISLDKGENTIKVVVKDEVKDKKRTYTLTVQRGKSKDNDNNDDTKNSNSGSSNNTTTNPKSQWVQTSDGWKYYDENGNVLKNSWFFDKDQKVYCYLDKNGLRVNGWFKDNSKWYYLNEKGAMLTGWQKVNDKWYLLGSDGAMFTGWYKETSTVQGSDTAKSNNNDKDAENWYYLNSDGSMRTGWLSYDGKWYFFNANGTMQRGWLIDYNSKYYLTDDGTMAIGTKTINGKEYKFSSNGALII